MDEVYLAGLFVGLMVQLWFEKSRSTWMLMMTVAVAFHTLTHLVSMTSRLLLLR